MRGEALLTIAVLGSLVWCVVAPSRSAMAAGLQPSYQVVQAENFSGSGPAWNRQDLHYIDWYQGQEGQWHRGPHGKWEWRGKRGSGDEWYWGQRGHWYKEPEPTGWQFGSAGLVCNNNGRDCRYGRYLPPNGEGMVNRKNPNLYWHCDSDGNHCNWARRPL